MTVSPERITVKPVNLTRAARRAERLPMSKLVEIEAKVSASRRSVRVGIDSGADAHMFVSAGAMGMSASFHAHTPAEAREYAQMLRGAADALLDWALTQEQPQNFAAAEDAQAKHDVTTPGTRQWSTEERARLRVWGFVPDKLTLAGEEYALKLLAAAEVAK